MSLREWRLGPRHLLLALAQLDFGGDLLPIEPAQFGATEAEHRVLRAQVAEEMEGYRMTVRGRLHADLADTLGFVISARTWIDGVWLPDRQASCPVRLRAVPGQHSGVLMVQRPAEDADEPGLVHLLPVGSESLFRHVIAALPAARPGARPGVSIRLSELGDAGTSPGGVLVDAQPARSRGRARVFTELCTAEHTVIGQLTGNHLDRAGSRHRSSALRFFDVPGDGRYQLFLHPDGDHATLMPCEAALLSSRMSELLAAVAAA